MTPRIRLALALASFLFTAVWSRALRASEAGMDPIRLRGIPQRLEAFVEDHTIAGAVTLVARRGHVASLEAVGFADLVARKAMRPEALFWIASMTKPITATAVLMLQDEGKLSVDDPVERYLPEFQDLWMVAERSTNRVTLKRPPCKLTLRHLLTHTSGLAEAPNAGRELTLAEMVLCYSQRPLRFEPGSQWEYSNPGINTLGRIVEVVSGAKFPDFLEERIFKPLGMRDTTFYPTSGQLESLAKSYLPREDGSGLEETEIFFLRGDLNSRERTAYPAGGLFSTAPDLFRFYQMALNGGTFEERRIVSSSSVKEMTRTQTGDLKTGFTEGMSFGLGWAVVRRPAGVTGMLSPGTFGHGGAYGTQGWIDPRKDLIVILMIQRAKLPNADGSVIRRAFQEAAVAAIEGRP